MRCVWGVLSCWVALASPAHVEAQVGPADAVASEPAEPAGYASLIDDALVEYQAQSFEEARSLFVRAFELFPNARALRGIGMAEFELKNYGECIKRLEAALSHPVRPLSGELRAEAQALLSRAEGYVARVSVEARPAEARVIVDGVPVELAPDEALTLSVGAHVLEFQAPGYSAERRSLRVTGGEEPRLLIVLSKLPNSERRDEIERPWFKNPWLWSGVGVAVVGAGVATAFLLQPENKERAGEPTTTPNTPAGAGSSFSVRF